ncbi:MAG: hypothetical protein ACE5JV_01585 [Nitrososphaerales archaeon]
MAARIAEGLVIAGLVLLIIYGADEGASQGEEGGGFLPLDAMTRGIGLGGTAVALSTAAFFVSMRERSTLVSALLIVNGILVIIGGAMAVAFSAAAGSSAAGAYGVVGMGIWILALGIVKSIRARALKVT